MKLESNEVKMYLPVGTYSRTPWFAGNFFCWLNLLRGLDSAQVANPPPTDWPHRDGVPALMLVYVNAYEYKLDEITPLRVASYKKLLSGNLPSNGAPTRTKLEKLKYLATGLHQVVVYKATESTQSAFLKSVAGVGDAAAAAAADSESEGMFLKMECDCEEALRSGGTICPCALAVASAKYPKSSSRINLEHLLEKTAATRRPVGRPRKAEPGSCYGGGGGGASSSSGAGRHTPHYYHTTIINSGGLHFHKWRVVVDFEGDMCVGTIVSYRDDYHEERKPHTSKTPFTRLWKVRFFGDEDDEFEEYNAEELAKYLSRAHDEGVRGPAPEAGSEQLTTLPKACTAAVAEEDGEVE